MSAIISFGGIGLFLALIGHYSAAPALLLGAAGTAAGTVLGRPGRREHVRLPGATVNPPAIVMCCSAIGLAIWNSIEAGHDLLGARDPGVYLLTGKWIAGHGNLSVPGGVDWATKGNFFNWASPGVYEHGTSSQFQFNHLLPTLLAEADNIGGNALMFRVAPVLGAAALCVMYAVGCRVVRRPWLVLVALVGFSLCLPEVYVSRDNFSELATQVLLWGGIYFLIRSYTARSWSLGLLAGAAIGATVMSHVDSVIFLAALAPLGSVWWMSERRRGSHRDLLPIFGAVVVGVAPPAVLGTIDVQRHSGRYYHDLISDIHLLYAAVAVSVVLSFAILLAWSALPSIGTWIRDRRRSLGTLASWAVGIVLVLDWALRANGPKQTTAVAPAVAVSIANLQKMAGVPIQTNRTYGEQSLAWFDWYIGPVALALAILGLALLVHRSIRRGSVPATVLLAVAGAVTILYLWNPHNTPDQVWVMRRYVTASLPLFMVAAAVALDEIGDVARRASPQQLWSQATLAAGSACLVAFPLGTTAPVASFHADANYLPAVDNACHTVGANAAVLFPYADFDGLVLSQTFRSFCGVPAAILGGPIAPTQVSAVAAAFRSEGRVLWLVASKPSAITNLDPSAAPQLLGQAASTHELQATLVRPPQRYVTGSLTMYGAPVP